jgi:hypothetical protein
VAGHATTIDMSNEMTVSIRDTGISLPSMTQSAPMSFVMPIPDAGHA